jgi:hypothetical protein
VAVVLNVPGLNASPAASVPTNDWLRYRVYTDPAKRFVPLRVTVLTFAPTKLPWRTSYGATLTCTCSMASSEMGATPVRSPGVPVVVSSPNEPLKYEPSIVMLFARLSCPEKVPEPPYCGDSRMMSVIRPEMVGSDARSSRVMVVAAPVCVVLKMGSDVAVTTTSSASAATFSLKSRSAETPRLTTTPSLMSVANPVSMAVTL